MVSTTAGAPSSETGCAGVPSLHPMTGARTGSRVARVRATRVLAGIRLYADEPPSITIVAPVT